MRCAFTGQLQLPYFEGGDCMCDWVGDVIGFPRPSVPSINDIGNYTEKEWRAAHEPWAERDRYIEDLVRDVEAFVANLVDGGMCPDCESAGNSTAQSWACDKHMVPLKNRFPCPSGWLKDGAS
jgi:hypothetical protein